MGFRETNTKAPVVRRTGYGDTKTKAPAAKRASNTNNKNTCDQEYVLLFNEHDRNGGHENVFDERKEKCPCGNKSTCGHTSTCCKSRVLRTLKQNNTVLTQRSDVRFQCGYGRVHIGYNGNIYGNQPRTNIGFVLMRRLRIVCFI